MRFSCEVLRSQFCSEPKLSAIAIISLMVTLSRVTATLPEKKDATCLRIVIEEETNSYIVSLPPTINSVLLA